MHAWGAVDLRIYLAKKNHGYSISAKSYDFCPHFGKFNFIDKLYSLYITVGAKRLHVWHPRGIMDRNLFLVYSWPYIKCANIYCTQQISFFVVTNLTANFFVFLLLSSKVYAYGINGLQYCVAKMQTKSEMYAKYGHAIFFERNTTTKTGYQ